MEGGGVGRGGAKRGGVGAKNSAVYCSHTRSHAHDAIAQSRLGAASGGGARRGRRRVGLALVPLFGCGIDACQSSR